VTRRFRTYRDLDEPAGAALADQVEAQRARLQARLASVRSIVVTASGKGGVGKSFVAAHLARMLAAQGRRVGALDADLNGPSLPALLGVARMPLRVDELGVHPAPSSAGCLVMSSDLLLASPAAPVRWRGAAEAGHIAQSVIETGAVREFLSDVAWGELDVLVIDLPPGTDKIMRMVELLPRIDLMLLVTTPSRATQAVVARARTLVAETGVRCGVVSNMHDYECPVCRVRTPLFRPTTAGSDDDAWATIPFDPRAADATDRGAALPPDSAAADALGALAARVSAALARPEVNG
jgi:ATP-binding protein involved in chromosome partitioning